MKNSAIQAVLALSMVASFAICGEAPKHPQAEALTVTQCAPGVWRLRVGTPEAYVPSTFRTIPPRQEMLKGFSEVDGDLAMIEAVMKNSEKTEKTD